MALNSSKLLSGRVPVTSYDNLTSDRYQFLGLSQAEPSLGVPTTSGSLFTSTSNGVRSWSNAVNVNSNIVTFYNSYSFPNASPSSGQILVSNGNGQLVFATPNIPTELSNGNSNVFVYANSDVATSVAGNANVFVVTGTGAIVNGTLGVSSNITSTQIISNASVGTAPFVVTSTTQVANLNSETSGTSNTVTNGAQPNITSVGTLSSLTVAGTSNLGSVSNVKITGGFNNYVLATDGTGNLKWTSVGQGNGIANGTSNIIAGTANGNITVSIGNISNTVVFANTGVNITGNLTVAGNITNSNVVSANYLTSTQGCVSIAQGVIVVSGNSAGIFTTLSGNINIGLDANVTIGSSFGNVISQGTLNASNIISTGTITANNITVSDLYSNRTPVGVPTTSTIIDSFGVNEYRSAKYTINANNGSGYQALEVLLIHDSINSITTVYGNLTTTGSDIITIDSSITTGTVQLLATSTSGTAIVNLLGTYVP
jgi:hypothetical protein